MIVQDIDIDKIIPYENNPRKNDRAVAPVAASIKQFGFKQPLVVDKDMVVIIGHTRLRAAKQLGYKTVPVYVADLSPKKARALRLIDNKSRERSEWDMELLEEEYAKLVKFTAVDMSAYDFDIDVDAVLRYLDEQIDIPPEDEGEKKTRSSKKILYYCPYCQEEFYGKPSK